MSSVLVWRAGKFYYQSKPSSGALRLIARTTNQWHQIIGRRRSGQGAMTSYCCMLVSCLLMWTSRSIYMHVVCFWHGIYKLLVQILVPISQKFIAKKSQFNGYIVSVYHIYLQKSSKCSSLSGNYMWLFISFWLVWLNFYSFARMTGMHICLYYVL